MSHRDDEHQHWWWADGEVAGGHAVVVDIDGVISDGWHRQHYLDGERRDWRGFFDAAVDDSPIESMMVVLQQFRTDVAMVLLTARPHRIQQLTLDWLVDHAVRWDLLVVRSNGHGHVSSPAFKREALGELIERGFEPLVAFDDDLRNVEMYNDEDVPVVYIHSGYYD